jgi:CubicO group peptidase (beta-lactamase class C family)
MRSTVPTFGALLLILRAAAAFSAQGSSALPIATPESVGMSTARLDAMTEYFRGRASADAAAGYVFMVARDGKLVDASAVGYRNVEQKLPMTLDTRFRIASMTKPITSVAVLMLYEQGRFRLDDPIARFLPEFANPRVYTGIDTKGAMTTEKSKRDITIRDLLTHSSGLGYQFDSKTLVGKGYLALKIDPHGSLADNIRLIASQPLYFQPGEGWFYSYADDVLGRLVEVVSGLPFAHFLRERLFVPLKMTSTGFYVPADAKKLVATAYGRDTQASMRASTWLDDPSDARRWPSGGAGLISTAGDYLRFAQMLANGGTLDGHQYLSPVTVDLMTHNQVPEDAQTNFWGAGSTGLGFGLGVGVEIDTRHATHAGYPGDFAWDGIFDTHWIASPRTGIVAVLLAQNDSVGADSMRLRTDNANDFLNLLFAAATRPASPSRVDPMELLR